MRRSLSYELVVDLETLPITRLRGVEQLGRPARFELWCRPERSGFDIDGLLRAAVSIRIGNEAGEWRVIEGIVTDAAVGLPAAGEAAPMRLIVESRWAVAAHVNDMRVFRNQSTAEIVAELLAEHGVRVDARTREAYSPRNQTVQLRESNLDFALRLLEEEGIVLFERPGKVVVLADDTSGYDAWGRAPLPFDPGGALERSADALLSIAEKEDLAPAHVVARDFRRARPSFDPTARVTVPSRTGTGTRHLWLRGPTERRDPARTARIVAEAIHAERSTLELLIASVHPAPGRVLLLTDLPDPDLPNEVLVVRITHELEAGRVAGLLVEAVPLSASYRVPRRTPRPVQAGPLPGFVVGPQHAAEGPGSDVFTDALGQVKVHYPWDRRQPRDARASDWVPVMQDQTGQSVAIPRVGWEVLVHFFEGDPDRPVVLGRLYDGGDSFPEPLPAGRTVSALRSASSPAGGGGKNMIRIDDAAGAERFDVHAERDQRVVVERDERRDVGEDRSREVAGDETVVVGASDRLAVGGDYDVCVTGDHSVEVGGTRSVWIGATDTVATGGAHELRIGGAHLRRIGRDDILEAAGIDERIGGVHCELALRNVTLSSQKAVTTMVGGASVGIARGGHRSSTKLARAETVGALVVSKSALDTKVETKQTHDLAVGGPIVATAGGSAEVSGTTIELDAIGRFLVEGATSLTLRVGDTEVVFAEGTMVVYGPKLFIDGESKLAWTEASITG